MTQLRGLGLRHKVTLQDLRDLSFEDVLNIGISGGLFQGTGTFAIPTTALKIHNSGGVGLLEMWGSGTKQVYFGTDGKLYAGAGKVRLDSLGLHLINAQALTFYTGADIGNSLVIDYASVGSLSGPHYSIGTYSGAVDVDLVLSSTINGAVTINGILSNTDISTGIKTLQPPTNDGAALGLPTKSWSDLFLASGAVVNFNNGDVTITHSANTLTFAGASSGYFFDTKIGWDGFEYLQRVSGGVIDLVTRSGVRILADSNDNDAATTEQFGIYTGSTPVSLLSVFKDGGLNLGVPTGGDKGAGTINSASNIYRNNALVAYGGGSTGATVVPNGTVTLVINGTSYYLLTAAAA